MKFVHERLEGQAFPAERLRAKATSAAAHAQVNNFSFGHKCQHRKILNLHSMIIIEARIGDDPLSAGSWAEGVAKVA